MKIELEDIGEQLTEKDIAEFEKKLNLKLPNDYRAFMLKNNGGTPVEDVDFRFCDVVSEVENETIIRDMYSFCINEERKFTDIMKINEHLHVEKQVPENYFAIGDDPGGNIICICVDGKDEGCVYFGNHELEDSDTGYIVFSKVEDSFTEFWDKLHISEC